MKVDPFEVTLINGRTNDAFKERRVNGIDYFVAIPGEEYKINVKLFDNLEFPSKGDLVLTTWIDGQKIGSSKTFQTRLATVRGFRLTDSHNLTAFTFNNTQIADVKAVNEKSQDIGFITLTLRVAKRKRKVEKAHPPRSNSFIGSLVSYDDKKFWQKASSCTTSGRVIRKIKPKDFINTYIQTIATVRLPYHTASVLDLMEMNLLPTMVTTEPTIKVEDDDNDENIIEVVEKESRKIPLVDLTVESETRRNKRSKKPIEIIELE